ncbi:malto-oligosyltrehalose trehalohydrolase [Propionicicella superfundia]|uniref:malto-oligosyltrehalose trehalohydrolase n=1 Tax=Propionicicella superfundia TaxID=348582 RepID=UPI0004121891|nr:malto-oligosyltrehalose trehalohydrolase [Propionicicella superfundia]
MELSVWAPAAGSVDLLINDAVEPLTRGDGGYWRGEVWPGLDYLLSVDGGPGRPDPRSRWQPHGVHGPTRAFDVGAHPWGDAAWAGADALGQVIYELHVGTFTPRGTLDAAIERLPVLAELGIGLVEVMPVAAFPGDRGWGYDGVDLYAVHDAYGGPAALQRFVDAAHGHGLGVVLDVVYNHLGPAGNYLSQFGPYFTDAHHTPWGWAVNLDQEGNEGVRRYLIDNALGWFRDFHVDALRLDAIQTLADGSEKRFLAQLSDETRSLADRLGRPLRIIGETDTNEVRLITPTAEGGDGLDGIWSDDFHHALHAYYTGERFGYYVDFGGSEPLVTVVEKGFWWDGRYSPYHGGPWGEPLPEDVDRRRLVACSENHDQVGNRAAGDRPAAALAPGALAGQAAVLLVNPGTPLLFQGQEWGSPRPFQYFTDHEPELGRAVSEGRRQEFAAFDWGARVPGGDVPDPQDRATFERSKLDWSDLRVPEHRELWEWYRTLIALRRETFGDGACEQVVDAEAGDGWFRMERGPLTVVLTSGPSAVSVPVGGEIVARFGRVDLVVDETTGTTELEVGPLSVAVLRH